MHKINLKCILHFIRNMTKKINFTDEALKQIEKIVFENKPKKYFRISVQGGGCSGFKYNFTFDDKIENDDLVFNKTIIDKSSLDIINGSVEIAPNIGLADAICDIVSSGSTLFKNNLKE